MIIEGLVTLRPRGPHGLDGGRSAIGVVLIYSDLERVGSLGLRQIPLRRRGRVGGVELGQEDGGEEAVGAGRGGGGGGSLAIGLGAGGVFLIPWVGQPA